MVQKKKGFLFWDLHFGFQDLKSLLFFCLDFCLSNNMSYIMSSCFLITCIFLLSTCSLHFRHFFTFKLEKHSESTQLVCNYLQSAHTILSPQGKNVTRGSLSEQTKHSSTSSFPPSPPLSLTSFPTSTLPMERSPKPCAKLWSLGSGSSGGSSISSTS